MTVTVIVLPSFEILRARVPTTFPFFLPVRVVVFALMRFSDTVSAVADPVIG